MMSLALALPTTVAGWAIAIVVIAALVALVLIALRQFNVTIPAWVQNVGWVLIVAAVVIGAIRILMSL